MGARIAWKDIAEAVAAKVQPFVRDATHPNSMVRVCRYCGVAERAPAHTDDCPWQIATADA